MRKKITRKVLDMLKKMAADDPERYLKFYKEYSNAIKFGIMEDLSNRERLAELLRFPSSTSAGKMVSLEEYVGRMKKGQDHIYLLAGTSFLEIDVWPRQGRAPNHHLADCLTDRPNNAGEWGGADVAASGAAQGAWVRGAVSA
jgi:hypothetical protein